MPPIVFDSSMKLLPFDALPIDDELGNYKLTHLIGSGSAGDVYVCEKLKSTTPNARGESCDVDSVSTTSSENTEAILQTIVSSQLFAIKVVSLTDPASLTHAKREVQIHNTVGDHPNIIKIRDIVSVPGKYGIVMDLAEGGDLFSEISRQHEATGIPGLEETVAKRYFACVISALIHIHSKGVAHRDIKPENVLLSGDKHTAYLCDFGLSSRTQTSILPCGTIDFAAPEALSFSSQGHESRRADVWSCGVLLFCLLTGSLPFSTDDSSEDVIVDNIISGEFCFPTNCRALSDDAQDLICLMLQLNPNKRPQLHEVLLHAFLGGIS